MCLLRARKIFLQLCQASWDLVAARGAHQGFDRASCNFTGLVGPHRGSRGFVGPHRGFLQLHRASTELPGAWRSAAAIRGRLPLSEHDALALSPPLFLFYSLSPGCEFRLQNGKKTKAQLQTSVDFQRRNISRYVPDMTPKSTQRFRVVSCRQLLETEISATFQNNGQHLKHCI